MHDLRGHSPISLSPMTSEMLHGPPALGKPSPFYATKTERFEPKQDSILELKEAHDHEENELNGED